MMEVARFVVWLVARVVGRRAALVAENAHYHAERNHQGLGNVIPFPSRDSASPVGRIDRIDRRERLGGVLSLYERNAA
jgi:hypothetical protein